MGRHLLADVLLNRSDEVLEVESGLSNAIYNSTFPQTLYRHSKKALINVSDRWLIRLIISAPYGFLPTHCVCYSRSHPQVSSRRTTSLFFLCNCNRSYPSQFRNDLVPPPRALTQSTTSSRSRSLSHALFRFTLAHFLYSTCSRCAVFSGLRTTYLSSRWWWTWQKVPVWPQSGVHQSSAI